MRSRTAPSREIKYVELVDQIDTPGPARAVAVSGDFAHVAAFTSSPRIIDVSDPAHPAEASVYDAPSKAYEVKVIGNRAYVGDVGTYFNGHYEVTGMIIVDVSDPHTPVEIGTWKTGGEPRGIEVAGSYAYVANSCPATGAKGLRIVDITNPVTPTESSFFETPGCALDLTVTGEYAYVAAQTYGLNVVDIQDPEHPMLAGQRETDNLAVDVAVEGNWACVAGAGYAFPETRGLWIMDVSDLQNITAPGFYNTPSTAEAVIVEGGYAFVAAFSRGLRLIDVSDPEAPAEVAFHETPGSSWNLDLVGNYVYVAEDQGLAILRILHDKARGLIPLEGGTLASSSGGTRLDFPSESFTRAISLAYGHLWRDQESEPMAGMGRTFELTAVHADSGLHSLFLEKASLLRSLPLRITCRCGPCSERRGGSTCPSSCARFHHAPRAGSQCTAPAPRKGVTREHSHLDVGIQSPRITRQRRKEKSNVPSGIQQEWSFLRPGRSEGL